MHARLSLAAALVVVAGCDPLAAFGEDETVYERDQATPAIEDDRIEDKHPVFDPSLTIDETFDTCTVTSNKSASVTKLDVVPFADGDPAVDGVLYAGYRQAADALGNAEVLPSMELVDAWLKPFDDGLYAAIELGAHDGTDGSLVNERADLAALLAELVARASSGTAAERPLAREAATQIAAALRAGGQSPIAPSDVLAGADALIAKFDADLIESRPLGFYTWSSALGDVFREDRFLQSPASVRPSLGAFADASIALASLPAWTDYQRALSLYAGLTNPYFDLSLVDVASVAGDVPALDDLGALQSRLLDRYPRLSGDPGCTATIAFLPESDSAENKLFRNLFCAAGLPAGTNLIDVLIDRIRSGALDLTPSANAGFYDRQLYALETLLVPDKAPEKDHLFLTKRYKEKLVDTFKTLIVERRDTHVKQLGGDLNMGGDVSAQAVPVVIDVYPKLPVEPFPTFYLRTARAYRFLEGVLASTIGSDFLKKAQGLRESAAAPTKSLLDELHDREAVLDGLHVLASASIGMRPQFAADEGVDVAAVQQRALDWLAGWRKDADVLSDPRVIVPVGHDLDTGTERYWAVLGVAVVKIDTQFYPGFEPTIVSATAPTGCIVRGFVDHPMYLFVGKTAEVALPDSRPPLTRDELRAICDGAKTFDDAVAKLQGG